MTSRGDSRLLVATRTLPSMVKSYSKPGQEGAVYGLDNSISAAGRGVAPMIGSYVTAWFGNASAFIATSIIALVTMISAQILLPKAEPLPADDAAIAETLA